MAIGAKPFLVGGAVQRDQGAVDVQLVFAFKARQDIEDLVVDGLDRPEHAFAAIALVIAVSPLHRLMGTGRGPRGHRCTAKGTAFQGHLHLHRGIAAGIQYFPAANIDDCCHGLLFPLVSW